MNWSGFIAGAGLLLILVFIPLVRQSIKQRNANKASAPAATAGGTPGATVSTTTTASTSPTPANKWSGWVKPALMVIGIVLVLWLIIFGPADWIGDVARLNWATSTALGAWLAGTVGTDLANLLMWGLLGGAILLAVLVWTGKHKGVAKTISSIPIMGLGGLVLAVLILVPIAQGIGSWVSNWGDRAQTIEFYGLNTGNVLSQMRRITVTPEETWYSESGAVRGTNRHPNGYWQCVTSANPIFDGMGHVFTSRMVSVNSRWEYQLTPQAHSRLDDAGIREFTVVHSYMVGGPGGSNPCTQMTYLGR